MRIPGCSGFCAMMVEAARATYGVEPGGQRYSMRRRRIGLDIVLAWAGGSVISAMPAFIILAGRGIRGMWLFSPFLGAAAIVALALGTEQVPDTSRGGKHVATRNPGE